MSEKKKAVLMTSNKGDADRVYDADIRAALHERYDFDETLLSKGYLEKNPDAAKDAEYIFTTWGMQAFTKEEIKKYFPNVKAVFYAAGSVQHFAKQFIDSGIRVFSAWKANAIPVAEYTYAEILLATKGFYRAERISRFRFWTASRYSNACGGNYKAKIGIVGVGSIGRAVAQKLAANSVEVYYYDPFFPEEVAKEMGIHKASLEEIFKNCDVISNHLANKDELVGIYNAKLFNSMKPYAVFINTGRGRQVDEKALYKAMKKVKTRTALLDVTFPEPCVWFNKLRRCKNIIVTPHIAGSNGREVVRMAQYMLDDAKRIEENEAPLYEVSAEMLKTMA